MTTIAIALPLLWLAWLALTEWVPMFPLNDLRPGNLRRRLLAAAINYPFPLLVAAGVALHRPWSLIAASALCGLILAGHLTNWWLPYFGPSSEAQRQVYERDYARTLKIVPAAGHAVVPDVQHMVVGLLSLAMLGTTLAVTLAT
ncbi:hypothetical protein AB0392_45395 [Nonomuraea angiospora]|uniref:hypothetical protein n=1 Tax=Nonomuraea angiospora TaxID=46172 RepID=UPI00344C4F21